MPLGFGSVGRVRSTVLCILLFVVTFGIYGLVWWYQVHEEMKRHSGAGLGGGIALLIALLVGGIPMSFVTSDEVGKLYQYRGQPRPVSGWTGLWYFPGFLLVVGPLVWFVQTNAALNSYWRALGAR